MTGPDEHTVTNHRGEEVVLQKPLNESAMTDEQKRAWREAHQAKESER